MRSLATFVVVSAFLCLSQPAAAQPPYHGVDLYTVGTAQGISIMSSDARIRDGATMGGWSSGVATGNRAHATLWSPANSTGMDLNRADFFASELNGTNATQQFGAARLNSAPSVLHATMWSGTPESSVDLHPGNYDKSRLRIGESGAQVGSASGGDGAWHGMVWHGTASSAVDLHPPEYASSDAYFTDGQQQVGVGFLTTSGSSNHAVMWSGRAASFVDLNPTVYSRSEALGVAQGYQVGVVFNEDDGEHAAIWHGSAASVVVLAEADRANAISPDGMLIVGTAGAPNEHAIAWDRLTLEPIDLHSLLPPGFSGSTATGVGADGTIYGTAYAAGGPLHVVAWVVPEPVAALPMVLMGLSVFRFRRR